MSTPLCDVLQIWGIENSFVIFTDASLGFALNLTPLDISSWDELRIDNFGTRLGFFLNGLADHTDIQFVQEIERGNGELISNFEKASDRDIGKTIQALHNYRVKYLKNQDETGLIPVHGLKCFIRKPFSTNLLKKPRIFSRPRLFERVAEERLKKEISQMERLRDEIMNELSSLGLEPRQIPERKLVEVIFRQWNPLRQIPQRFEPEDIRPSIVFTDIAVSQDGFSIGVMRHRVISLKLLPEQTFSLFAESLRALPLNSRVFVSIHVPNQVREVESLQGQRRLAFAMVQGTRGIRDIDSESKLTDIETLLQEMISQGEKVFRFSLNVVLQAKNQEELDNQVSNTLSAIRSLGGTEAMEETLASFDVFTELSMPNARATERAKRLKTSNLVDFLPLYGPWKGHSTGRVLLKSALGSLVKFDPFSPALMNANQIVAGGSGSGKSFLANMILLQMLKENPRVFIIDIGASYKKLCENLDGQYIPLSMESTLSINPFELAEGEKVPSHSKIKFLVGLVEMCCKEENEKGLSRLKRAEIEEIIKKTYETVEKPRLSDLMDFLTRHEDNEIRRLGKILSTWCGDTPYGKFIDKPTTMKLQKRIVSFDLKGLKTYRDLQAVLLYIITDFVWWEIQRDKSYKFLIFDECWSLLENEAGAAFIGECYRTFRKYNASAIGISQNIDDFAESRVAAAILPNSATKWILQKGGDQERLKSVLQLNDREMTTISGLHQKRGLYSQAFLMTGDNHSLVLIEPTPFEYWIGTTDPTDLNVIEMEQAKNPESSNLQILTELSKKYPRGVSNEEGE